MESHELFSSIVHWVIAALSTLIWGGQKSLLPYNVGAVFFLATVALFFFFIFNLLYWVYGVMKCHYGRDMFESKDVFEAKISENKSIKGLFDAIVMTRSSHNLKMLFFTLLASIMLTFLISYVFEFISVVLVVFFLLVLFVMLEYKLATILLVALPASIYIIRRRNLKMMDLEDKLSGE